MGLSTSLFSGLSGLAANSQMLTVAGNNIANVNTNAFKKSRITFESQFSQTLNSGSAPTGDTGGTNPSQVGMGTRLGTIRRDFSSGGLQPTGVSTDMAMEGNGFFVVDVAGERRFTRDGGFILDRDFNLVAPGSGGLVQGYGVDDDFNVVDGVLTNVNVPIGVLTLAEATTQSKFAGNLNAGGDVATVGSRVTSEAMYSDNTATTPAAATDDLTALFDADGNQLYQPGDIITITGATRGGSVIRDYTFQIPPADPTDAPTDASGTTVQDFMDFMDNVLGIDGTTTTTTGTPPTTWTPGISMNGTGQMIVQSNVGTANDIVLRDANIVRNKASSPSVPLTWTKGQDATGESVRTTFLTYDSLGNETKVDMTIVLENKSNAGTTWRFYANADKDTDLDTFLSTGELAFDNEGQLISTTNGSIQIDHTNTGALTPHSIELTFEDQFGSVTALADDDSQVSSIFQDGSPLGSLEDFTVGEDGEITGIFSNGLLRTLGRIPVAMFANNEGLEEVGGNLFRPSVNSGTATMVTATTAGSGKIVGRALELSNVELSDEFVNLISATTGFTASSRVVTTSDRLIQELLNTVR